MTIVTAGTIKTAYFIAEIFERTFPNFNFWIIILIEY